MDKIIEERELQIRANKAFPILDERGFDNDYRNGGFNGYLKGATEQKAIDETELAEVRKQRDAYYDELLKLRAEKAEGVIKLPQRFRKVLNRQKRELIEKACEWLKNWMLSSRWHTMEESLEMFRKALEE